MVFLLLFIFSINVVGDIQRSEFLDSAKIQIDYTVLGVTSNNTDVSLKILNPINNNFQNVVLNTDCPKDSKGDAICKITNKSDFMISFSFIAQTNNRVIEIKQLPQIKQEITEYSQFKEDSQYATVSEEISLKAKEITKNAKNVIEQLVLLHDWFVYNVTFDPSCGQRMETAQWVLENQRGVCDEYANLFIAFSRALGYPARFVFGYAYALTESEQYEWQNHAWVEVYIPSIGWFPIDPLFHEIGWLDASHVGIAYGMDSSLNKLIEIGDNIMILDVITDISFISKKDGDSVVSLNTSVPTQINNDDYLVIGSTITNKGYSYIISPLQLMFRCLGCDVSLYSGKEYESIILPPKTSATKYWTIKTNMDNGVYPIHVLSELVASNLISIDSKEKNIFDYTITDSFGKNDGIISAKEKITLFIESSLYQIPEYNLGDISIFNDDILIGSGTLINGEATVEVSAPMSTSFLRIVLTDFHSNRIFEKTKEIIIKDMEIIDFPIIFYIETETLLDFYVEYNNGQKEKNDLNITITLPNFYFSCLTPCKVSFPEIGSFEGIITVFDKQGITKSLLTKINVVPYDFSISGINYIEHYGEEWKLSVIAKNNAPTSVSNVRMEISAGKKIIYDEFLDFSGEELKKIDVPWKIPDSGANISVIINSDATYVESNLADNSKWKVFENNLEKDESNKKNKTSDLNAYDVDVITGYQAKDYEKKQPAKTSEKRKDEMKKETKNPLINLKDPFVLGSLILLILIAVFVLKGKKKPQPPQNQMYQNQYNWQH